MARAPRITRAQAVAVPRPAAATDREWTVALVALALLFAALLVR